MKPYRRISSASDLKVLHEEAKTEGKLEVGLSRGNILYAWDEARDNLRTITTDEAAIRLGLTTKQIDKIIETGGEVTFEEEKADDLESTFQDELLAEVLEESNGSEDQESDIPEVEVEDAPEETKTEELATPDALPEAVESETPTVVKLDAPERVQEVPKDERLTKTALTALADSIIEVLEEFKAFIKD